ncbi:LIN1-like protein [Termitomyces sp. J132]|nr:hypothetical protein H2248_009384 [Termitomyces sp. 'cryptogamus']KNZ71829.1 LIN1-like protein [Termitomyces sp. J132]
MKRAATTSATSSSSKKTRFVDPADDPVRFADDVDAALESTSHRRNRVRTEGYDSDSSDDGEGVRKRQSRQSAGNDGDDDDDMFAIGDKPDAPPKNEYLRLGDIEGQEFNDSHSASSSSDSEPEDEDDAERRKKAGMGYEMSSFNMRDEMEEGKFTEDGNYVRTVDVHAVHDRWMDGFSEREIKLARRRKRQHDKAQRDKIHAEERELEQSGGTTNLEIQLLAMLKKGETVLEALQRLGVQAKKSHSKSITAPSSQIEKITHLASNIMALGESDIYDKTYEEIVRAVRSSASVDDSWVPPSADLRYEYKWDIPTGHDQTFGPFSEEEMKAWFKASYFGVAGEKVKVRALGAEWGDWDDVIQ